MDTLYLIIYNIFLIYIEKEVLKHARENNKLVVYCEKNDTLYIISQKTDASDDLRSPVQALVELCTRLRLRDLTVAKSEENRKLIREIKKAKGKLKEKDIHVLYTLSRG
jgi:hypothetical protein